MTSDQIFEQLKKIIIEELDLNLSYDDLADERLPLFEGGLRLDSVVTFELIALVERRFGIEVPESMLRMEAFKDLRSVVDVIEERLAVPRIA